MLENAHQDFLARILRNRPGEHNGRRCSAALLATEDNHSLYSAAASATILDYRRSESGLLFSIFIVTLQTIHFSKPIRELLLDRAATGPIGSLAIPSLYPNLS